MARTEEVVSIFLASPGDVHEERTRLAETIGKWNRAWSRDLGLRLELLRWEDDAYPDIGEDGQDVINRQIPDDWDIFIGIMWARFGTPTGRAQSGTEEEFNRALLRRKEAPESVRLMFYFKNAQLSPNDIDPDQLGRVQRFRSEVQSEGLLHWTFSDTDEFEELVNLHISKHVQAWRSSRKSEIEAVTQPSRIAPTSQADDEIKQSLSASAEEMLEPDESGYLDVLEDFADKAKEIESVLMRVANAQTTLTEKTNVGRIELDRLREVPTPSPKQMRASIARVADHMLTYAMTIDGEAPQLRVALSSSLGLLNKFVVLAAELYPEQLAETRRACESLLEHIVGARTSSEGFRDGIEQLPRMTKELNVAKRKQVAAMNSLIDEFQNGERLLVEAIEVLDGLTPKD